MKILFKRDISEKPRNRWRFAWWPVIAKDKINDKYIVWLEQVFRVDSIGLISYQVMEKE